MVEIQFLEDIVLDADFEQVYPEQFRVPLEVKKQLHSTGTTFIYILNKETREPIGETYYLHADYLEQMADGINITDWIGKKAAYIYKNTIFPKFQGQGYGKLLTEYRIKRMREQGFKYSIGHARQNGSVKQAKLFGADVVAEIPNWCGETASLCVLDLNKIPASTINKAAIVGAIKRGHQLTEKLAYRDGFADGVIFAQTIRDANN